MKSIASLFTLLIFTLLGSAHATTVNLTAEFGQSCGRFQQLCDGQCIPYWAYCEPTSAPAPTPTATPKPPPAPPVLQCPRGRMLCNGECVPFAWRQCGADSPHAANTLTSSETVATSCTFPNQVCHGTCRPPFYPCD